jgi:hypothetical protein
MTNKARTLILLQYLKDNTDESKDVTNTDIRKMFRQQYGHNGRRDNPYSLSHILLSMFLK